MTEINKIFQCSHWSHTCSEAKTAIDKALIGFPNNASIAKLNANYFQVTENYSRAIDLYRQLLNSHPNSSPIKNSLAVNLRLDGQAEQALSLYNELEQAGVAQFQLFHNKANALSDLGQRHDAIQYYRKAIELNPSYVESHVNLNELLWETGDTWCHRVHSPRTGFGSDVQQNSYDYSVCMAAMRAAYTACLSPVGDCAERFPPAP